MMNRRRFVSLSFAGIASPAFGFVPLKSGSIALYANVGSAMWHYDVDPDAGTLTRRAPFALPASVQYAWPHASRRCLYVVSSDGVRHHFLSALSIDPATGELSKLGEPIPLPDRPINVTTDIPSAFVLVAFNTPSSVRVYAVRPDLGIGPEIPEPNVFDGGIYAHQIRITPDDQHAIFVTRGVPSTATQPEWPGALKMFDYKAGLLSNEATIAPGNGIGFEPRHLDFHPTRPWVYVSLEAQSKLFMYRLENGRLASAPDFMLDTVADPLYKKPRQLGGAIHVHPNGGFVYVSNRADSTVDFGGKKVFAGGENTIAVFAINSETGEPTLVQHIDTRKIYPRTFQIDPTQRILIAQHTLPLNARDGDKIRVIPAGFTIFRIGSDGKLTFERVVDVETGQDTMFWMGMVKL